MHLIVLNHTRVNTTRTDDQRPVMCQRSAGRFTVVKKSVVAARNEQGIKYQFPGPIRVGRVRTRLHYCSSSRSVYTKIRVACSNEVTIPKDLV